MHDNIVSDSDPNISSKFWDRLMDLCGVKLNFSSSRHPQTSEALKVFNRMVDNFQHFYCSYHQNFWDNLLPPAYFDRNPSISDYLGISRLKLIRDTLLEVHWIRFPENLFH